MNPDFRDRVTLQFEGVTTAMVPVVHDWLDERMAERSIFNDRDMLRKDTIPRWSTELVIVWNLAHDTVRIERAGKVIARFKNADAPGVLDVILNLVDDAADALTIAGVDLAADDGRAKGRATLAATKRARERSLKLEALAMRQKNPRLSTRAIAQTMCDRHKRDGLVFETFRKDVAKCIADAKILGKA